MIISQRFLNYSPKLTISEHLPEHLILIILKNNQVILLDTTNPKYSAHHESLKAYCGWYNIKSEKHEMHWLNFKDITNEKLGKSIMLKYSTIKSIYISKS